MTPVVIALIVLLCAVVCAGVGYGIFLAVHMSRSQRAVLFSVDNELDGRPGDRPVKLEVEPTVEPPDDVTPHRFDFAAARVCGQLVARLQLVFRQGYGGQKLRSPAPLMVHTELTFQGQLIGAVFAGPHRLWVAFRGTTTDEEWRRDFQFLHRTTHFPRQMYGAPCHAGFVSVFEELRPQLAPVLREARSVPVFTGHSLGAALATLCWLEWGGVAYVFGSPRVCATLPEVPGLFRVVNDDDPVVQLPLSVMWNRAKPEEPFQYQHGGEEWRFRSADLQRASLTNAHLMPVYLAALERPGVFLARGLHEKKKLCRD